MKRKIDLLPENNFEEALLKSNQANPSKIFKKIEKDNKLSEVQKLSFINNCNSSFAFAQMECGSAVCVSPKGLILTNLHCIEECKSKEDASGLIGSTRLIVANDGVIHLCEVINIDFRKDLSLLKSVAFFDKDKEKFIKFTRGQTFNFSSISSKLNDGTKIICIGHPALKGYGMLHLSKGKFLGIHDESDIQNNSEIGQLKHTAWTYWGHSGGGIFNYDGEIVGLHSSWNEKTGIRHGCHLKCIMSFLKDKL